MTAPYFLGVSGTRIFQAIAFLFWASLQAVCDDASPKPPKRRLHQGTNRPQQSEPLEAGTRRRNGVVCGGIWSQVYVKLTFPSGSGPTNERLFKGAAELVMAHSLVYAAFVAANQELLPMEELSRDTVIGHSCSLGY